MNDNPYAPPAESVERPASSDRMVGDFAQRLSFREVAYLAVAFFGLMLGAHRGRNDDTEGMLLWISFITFVFHCILLLQTRGFARSTVITTNAVLIFASWIWGDQPLVFVNVTLHVVFSFSSWLLSRFEAHQIATLLKSSDAVRALEKSIELKGESVPRLQALGDALRNSKRYSEALTVMQRCMQLAPENFATHLIIAWLLGETGAYTEAEQAYDRLSKQPLNTLQRLQVDSNYCRLLAVTMRTEECHERLDVIEKSLNSSRRILVPNYNALAASIQETRHLLKRPTSPLKTGESS